MNRIDPHTFFKHADDTVLLDVRSPSEFSDGHIPGSNNLPVFTDEERKVVGTLYKKAGRDVSVLKGMEFVGPKLVEFVKKSGKLATNKKVILYCWRGGLRSKNMGWILHTAGFEVTILEGGYKAYRRYIRKKLEEYTNLIVIGGKTGSGKTDILRCMPGHEQQIVDLERIAHHKGSAFGDLGQSDQPSNEQFENDLFEQLRKKDPHLPIWIEDESRGIGKIGIPDPFFRNMRKAPVFFVDMPKKNRVKRLVNEYASFPSERLEAGILRIHKRLGGLNVKMAVESLKNNDYETVAEILLTYYDKAYLKGLSRRDPSSVRFVGVENDIPEQNAIKILDKFKSLAKVKTSS